MERLKKERYLSVDKMQEIYNAFNQLNQLLTDKGFPAVSLVDNTFSYNLSPAKIIDKMNAVEQNITAMHNITNGRIEGWQDKYYKKFKWTSETYNIKSEVYRWIDWINSFYKMLTSVKAEYLPLRYSDGKAIYSSEQKPIYYKLRRYEVK